ncbi:hypothetical protein FACS1894202_08580 [Clostridia bacterium]|nr:hypothetical protein FACS1894202_08580 [Clostridia bacterium]
MKTNPFYRTLALALTVLMVMSLAPITAFAAEENYTLYFRSVGGTYNLYMSDTDNSSAYTGNDGKWSVNGSTLTLKNGFEFVTSAGAALRMATGTAIVVGSGTATISSTAAAVVDS